MIITAIGTSNPFKFFKAIKLKVFQNPMDNWSTDTIEINSELYEIQSHNDVLEDIDSFVFPAGGIELDNIQVRYKYKRESPIIKLSNAVRECRNQGYSEETIRTVLEMEAINIIMVS